MPTNNDLFTVLEDKVWCPLSTTWGRSKHHQVSGKKPRTHYPYSQSRMQSNSDGPVITKSRVLQADWFKFFTLENYGNATLHINIHYCMRYSRSLFFNNTIIDDQYLICMYNSTKSVCHYNSSPISTNSLK